MKKTPSEVLKTKTSEGAFNLNLAPIFKNETDKKVWIDRGDSPEDSKVLVTISDPMGVNTSLISGSSIEEVSANHFIRAPEERIETANYDRMVMVAKAGKIFGYVGMGILLLFSSLSMTGIIKARVVLTGSMKPAIMPGDVVLTMNPKYSQPKIGSIVTYQGRTFAGQPVGIFSHRVIAGNANTGFVVKGDNNPSPDVQHPKMPDILGVTFFVIPFIGKFLTKQALVFMIPIIAGLWIAFDGLREAPSED